MNSFRYRSRMTGVMLVLGGILQLGCSHVRGSGYPIEEPRSVTPFTELVVSGHMILHLTIGGTYAVSVYGDDNVVAATDVIVDGSALRIQAPKGIVQKQPLEVTVVTPDLKRISAALTEDVTINVAGNPLNDVDVGLSGVGRLRVHGLVAKKITSEVDGTGTLAIVGSAEDLDFQLSGMGKGEFQELCLKSAQVRVYGMGKVIVNASESLDATVKGVGKVQYIGSPDLKRKVSGGGKIEPFNETAAMTCTAAAVI